MRIVLATVSLFAWGLWIGGLIFAFVVPTGLFARDRALAIQANPVIFSIFERYQLILAAVALASLLSWRIAGGSLLTTAVFVMLCLAAIPAVVAPTVVSPRMRELIQQRRTDTQQFKRLHGYSMMLYSAEGAALIVAGLVLPAAIVRGHAAKESELKSKPDPNA